jgi:hypothetical protein
MKSAILFLIIFLFLAGCKTYSISISTPAHSEAYDYEKKAIMDYLSFNITNNNSIPLDCTINFVADNSSDSVSVSEDIQNILPSSKKNVTISFQMPSGKSSIKLSSDCKQAST